MCQYTLRYLKFDLIVLLVTKIDLSNGLNFLKVSDHFFYSTIYSALPPMSKLSPGNSFNSKKNRNIS